MWWKMLRNVIHSGVVVLGNIGHPTNATKNSAHLDTMFGVDAPPLEWDTEGAYRRDNLELFYLSNSATPLNEDQLTEALFGGWPADVTDEGPSAYGRKAARWRRLREDITLAQLLAKKDYVVPGVPVVFVVARGTAYYDRFLSAK